MRPPASSFGKLLLVSGLSSAATFALCILYVHTQGQPGPKTALKPLPQQSRIQASLFEKGFEPRLLEEEEGPKRVTWTWGRHHNCSGGGPKEDRWVSYHLNWTECTISFIIFTFIGGLEAFIVAVFLNVFWHCIRPWHQLNSFLRELSLGVIVLNIFYCERFPDWVLDHPVRTACFVVCVEAIIFRLMDVCLFTSRRNKAGATDGKQKLDDLWVVNRYQLPTSSFVILVSTVACQITLSLFYIYSLNNNKMGWADSSGWRWFIGFLLCNLAGEDEVGHVFQFQFWLELFHTKDRRMQNVFCKIGNFNCEIWMRMLMSMSVNMFIRRIVFCTAPILLSIADDPLEFIKEALAVFFINKLDDLVDKVKFVDSLEQKKTRDRKDDRKGCCNWRWGQAAESESESESESAADSESEEDVDPKIKRWLEKRLRGLQQV